MCSFLLFPFVLASVGGSGSLVVALVVFVVVSEAVAEGVAGEGGVEALLVLFRCFFFHVFCVRRALWLSLSLRVDGVMFMASP